MNNQEKEVWVDVEGYDGDYQISDLGNVKSLKCNKEMILKTAISRHNYFILPLSNRAGIRRTHRVHVLVAVAFKGHKPDGTMRLVVGHLDHDKLNNRADNLKITTQRENSSDWQTNCSSKHTGVGWHKPLNKWRACMEINGKTKHLGYFVEEIDASNAYQNKLKTI